MKYKIILLLLAITFNTEAKFNDLTLEDITLLSNRNEISYEEGIEALLKLPEIFSSRDFDHIENPEEKEKQLRQWKTLYNQIHNKLFLLTHIARIRRQISSTVGGSPFRFARHKWQTQSLMNRLIMKRTQLRALKATLEIISAGDFDHSAYQFNSLSDPGRINTKGFADTNGSTINIFSPSFSKSVLKGGYELNPFSTSLVIELPDSLKVNLGEENIAPFEKEQELRDYSGPFISRYLSARAADLFYRKDTTLSEEALQFLSRLGIEGPTPYLAKKDLSYLYRTAPPSQAKSYACVGFALAADIEFELQRTRQIRRNEILSPYSVYATLRYQEDQIPSPDCLRLHSLSDTIAKGQWEMDTGYGAWDFSNVNFCLISSSGDTVNHTGYVSIKNVEDYGNEITFLLLKSMIDHRMPPVILIDSDSREEIEDWINITNNYEDFGHVFVVVGYGIEDIDPFTLRKGPYFLVRDSLASQPITYKISAGNLLDHSLAVLKISQLERH